MKKLKQLIQNVEKKLSVKAKVGIGAGLVLSFGLLTYGGFFYEKQNLMESTVMISMLDRFGGGTGIVLESGPTQSLVLTNKHVCSIVKKGAMVTKVNGDSHLVDQYLEDTHHDLCLIRVAANLKGHTKLAAFPPEMYETAIVSGHPNLLPNVITSGHFSGKKIIQIMVGSKPCDPATVEGDDAIICAFFGRLPIIETYESILVTATIMAGSSGSGVYNSKGELSGVIFAGKGDLSYGFTVPHEYVSNFVNRAQYDLTNWKRPNYVSGADKDEDPKAFKEMVLDKCKGAAKPEVAKVCRIVKDTL